MTEPGKIYDTTFPEPIPTGLPDLDECLGGGMRPGQLIVIAGFPSHGASITADTIARYVGACAGRAVLVVALESTTEETIQRFLSAHAKVPLYRVQDQRMTDEEWDRIQKAADLIAAQEITLTHEARSIEAVESAIGHNTPDLLVIDGAHLLAPDHDYGGRAQFADDDARRLKQLAIEYGMAVAVTLPLEMPNSHSRFSNRPLLRDFGKRQSYAQTADVVILPWRPDAEESEDIRAGEIDLIVAKIRNGRTATVTVAFQGHYARLMNFAKNWKPTLPDFDGTSDGVL